MALREINLIPGEILERRTFWRHLFLWSCGLLLVVLLVTATNGYWKRMVHGNPQARQAAIKDQAAALARLVGEIGKGQQELNLARRERLQLASLIRQRRSYASALATLSDGMNDRTWLMQLAFMTAQGRTLHLNMTGFSDSHEHLGSFLQRLSGEPLFSRVVLKSAQESQERARGAAPVRFQIECDIAKEGP